MRRLLAKLGYVIARQTSASGLPHFRRLRNWLYARHLRTNDINVDDFVRIGPAHKSATARLSVGRGLRVGRSAEIDSTGGVDIGLNVTISEDVKIYTHDHIIDDGEVDWRRNGIRCSKLVIEDYAWIGVSAIVLSSVARIGYGSVVAAGAVVRQDVPPLAICAGNPARVIRYRRIAEATSNHAPGDEDASTCDSSEH